MSLDISRVRAICFDVDGTLSDTDDLWVNRLALFLTPIRSVFPRRDPRQFARWCIMAGKSPGNLLFSMLDWAHLDDDVGRVVSFLVRRRARPHPAYFLLIPGVRDCLVSLSQKYPLAVVSARDEAHTLAFLNFFNLRELFHCVASAYTCPYTKPFPDPVLWAAGQMGVEPGETLMVGDTPVDIHAGRSAGAQTVGVLSGFGRETELRRAGADLILDTAAGLPELLVAEPPHRSHPDRLPSV